ncbi:MAG: ABC transporter permease [Chthoniobacterales bacterium]|jgi:ABC-2 type transport system permease protein|nr:ABC transporter permease [Chthoniobacterales bacterium]
MKFGFSLQAVSSVAVKEFIHIYRDWRILVLLLILPPVFTLIFGHAFEDTGASNVPALLENRDHSPASEQFVSQLTSGDTFKWKMASQISGHPDLLKERVQAALVIPQGWGAGLKNGDPVALPLYLDGSDSNTVNELEGRIRESLGEFQKKQLETTVENLPENVIDMAKALPVEVRKEFVSAMSKWDLKTTVLYNPRQRFIDYVVPGVIGIILQLLTVTLTACTIARERESGTLYQLMVTSLRRVEIVLGKILPYLAISIVLILVVIVVAGWHFHVAFHQPFVLAIICLLFLLCSLGLGLLISAFSHTQTQAIQLSVFFLLPIFVLSGAFAPLERLPFAIRVLSECFPLTHFCRAFRLVNLYGAGPSFYGSDLIFMLLGAVVTFLGAALLLRRIQE